MPEFRTTRDIEKDRTEGLAATAQSLLNLNEKWLGFKFVLAGTSLDRAVLSLPAIGISEIVFPTVTPELATVPSLSTEETFVISRWLFGEMTIKAPVTRDASLFSLVAKQKGALDGRGYEPFDLVIAQMGTAASFEKGGKASVGRAVGIINSVVPIAIYFALGCQATSFTPASANAQNNSEMPMDELRLRVTDFYRPTL